MVYVVNGVLASGVDMLLEKDFARWDKIEDSQNEILNMMQSFCKMESIISLNEIVSQIPPSIAITPVLPTMEPEDSLIIGNKDISTIPEKVSKEFIMYSVEDLVPIPSESEDTSGSDSECDLPSCNDFSPIIISEEKSMNLSNPLFDSNDDFTSSDDESLSDEDVPKDKVKIYSNPLFEFDEEYISSDVNPLFNEVLENIESKDSYVSNLDEPAILITPLFDANEDEYFDPGGDIDEIDDFLDIDVSTDIKDGYHDSEGHIIYLESLIINDTILNLPPKVCLDHDSKNLKDKPDNEDLKMESPFLLSSGSEYTIFDSDIFAFHFSSLEPVASHRSGTFMIARIMKTLVLVVLSIIHSIFNPLHAYIWESDILDPID
ncbi:hypothetical protein Tco_1107541 [Tanacetum coccineum]